MFVALPYSWRISSGACFRPAASTAPASTRRVWAIELGEVRQVGVFEQVGNEVAERVRVVLGLGDAPKRAQPTREVNDIDGPIKCSREQGRNGRRPPCRDHQATTCKVRSGAKATNYGQAGR